MDIAFAFICVHLRPSADAFDAITAAFRVLSFASGREK